MARATSPLREVQSRPTAPVPRLQPPPLILRIKGLTITFGRRGIFQSFRPVNQEVRVRRLDLAPENQRGANRGAVQRNIARQEENAVGLSARNAQDKKESVVEILRARQESNLRPTA